MNRGIAKDRITELSENELMDVNGGNRFTDAWDAAYDWCDEHSKGLTVTGCAIGGIALCATGIGIVAGAGIMVADVGAAAVFSTFTGGIGGVLVGIGITSENED